MPASTMDPITSVLNRAFHSNGAGGGGVSGKAASSSSATSSLELGLVSAAKKTLLSAAVAFDQPVKHLGGLNGVAGLSQFKKGGFVFLNPGKKNQQINGKEDGGGEGASGCGKVEGASAAGPPALPKPKIVFFPLNSVEVGYRSLRCSGAGMLNMGNTCYLNSTLQALFHTPALYNYLMSGVHQKQCKSNNGFLQSCIICAMTFTLKDTLQTSVTRPNRIYDKLKLICKHLIHGRQEDAHEFLRYLIESLQRSFLNSCHQAPASLDSASKETTPFNQIFGGYMRQDVTCLKCKYVSITFQHFMDLLLDIRNASNINEALDLHFLPEKIGNGDGGNMYKCEKCKVKVQAKKRSFVARPPVVLCVQLKRFSLLGGKISKPVQLNRRIDMGKFMKPTPMAAQAAPKELQYKLVSMITHVGPSPNCGHYTAIGEAVNGQFFQFDDSSVRPVSVTQALNTASYVVFYEMTKASKQAWADPDGIAKEAAGQSGSTSQFTSLLLNGVQRDGISAAAPHPSSQPKPCTVTSSSMMNGTAGAHHLNLPRTISAAGNKIGVVPLTKGATVPCSPSLSGPNAARKPCLVPYGDNGDSSDDDDDDDDEQSTFFKPSPITNGHAPMVSSVAPATKSPFVPRAVTINALKRSQEPRPCTPSAGAAAVAAVAPSGRDLVDPNRPSSASSNASDGSSSLKASRSGLWSITDTDHHNPSIHSDHSGGSTNGWKVTPADPKKQPDVADTAPAVSTEPLGTKERTEQVLIGNVVSAGATSSYSSTAASSVASTPEKRVIKRGSSSEDCEAELDRGRTKKVKKHTAADGDNSYNTSFSSKNDNNPFQNYQNRNYDKNRSSSSSSTSGNGSGVSNSTNYWNGSGGGGGGRSWNNHHYRDHSYHPGAGDANVEGRGTGRDNRDFYRRSHSSSSLNGSGGDSEFHRDRHRSNDRQNGFNYGGGGGGGGGGYRNNYRDNYYSDRRPQYTKFKR